MKASPQLNPYRPKVGIAPRITDAELITVSVMQALRGYHNESRWIRYARKSLIHLCGTSRETVHRSELAGWAGYGYCASHSRLFWGLRLHLVTTVHGLPV